MCGVPADYFAAYDTLQKPNIWHPPVTAVVVLARVGQYGVYSNNAVRST